MDVGAGVYPGSFGAVALGAGQLISRAGEPATAGFGVHFCCKAKHCTHAVSILAHDQISPKSNMTMYIISYPKTPETEQYLLALLLAYTSAPDVPICPIQAPATPSPTYSFATLLAEAPLRAFAMRCTPRCTHLLR